MTRRFALSTGVAFSMQTFALSTFAKQFEPTVTPEDFGASGDGQASDGNALSNMIKHVNSIPGKAEVKVRLTGRYLLRGTPNRAMAPVRLGKALGVVKGLPAVERDNVTFNAQGAELIVPPEFPFCRLKRGGDYRDSFFVCLQFLGDNCSVIGGTINGNLENRPTSRGRAPIGFGGAEFGLVMEGKNWRLEDVASRNWGTDSLLIAAPGIAVNCEFIRARRNCVSIVAHNEITEHDPVVIWGGRISGAGQWPRDLFNNPAAGLVVEGMRINTSRATVIVSDVSFVNNRLKDLQLSKLAYRCIVRNNEFSNLIRLRPESLGGHIFTGNRFSAKAQIQISQIKSVNEHVILSKNIFESNRKNSLRYLQSSLHGTKYRQIVTSTQNVYGKV